MMGMPAPIGEPGSGGVPCRRVPIYRSHSPRPRAALGVSRLKLMKGVTARPRRQPPFGALRDWIRSGGPRTADLFIAYRRTNRDWPFYQPQDRSPYAIDVIAFARWKDPVTALNLWMALGSQAIARSRSV